MDPDQYRLLAKYGTAGFEFIVAFLVPVGLGMLVDARWGLSPWCTVAGAGVGFAAGLYRLVRIAREVQHQDRPED
ncbi:MAG: AtpZ/AtpI family protein [Phycisphaerae bacterium]